MQINLGMPNKLNLKTQKGISGGFRGSQIKKSGEAVKLLDRMAPWVRGHSLGRFMGSTIQKTGKCGQTAGPIGTHFCTYNADESGNGHRLNKLAP